MIDLAAPKVAVPATVFMAVWAAGPQVRDFAPVLVPIISWIIIKFGLKLSITRADILTVTALSTVGTFVPLQGVVDPSIAIVLKGLGFLFIFAYLRIAFPQLY